MEKLYNIIGAGVATTESVPTAIAIGYYVKGNPEDASIFSANLGGDCDTIGAMTGGLCGAYTGIDGIPRKYIKKLEQVNNLDFHEIAKKIYEYRK